MVVSRWIFWDYPLVISFQFYCFGFRETVSVISTSVESFEVSLRIKPWVYF